MDRRAALKKLSAGGAIAAGGSMVLSSTDVAYAMSTTCTPPSGTWTASRSGSKITFILTLGSTDCGFQSATAAIISSEGGLDSFSQGYPVFTVIAKKTGGGTWTNGTVVTARVTTNWDNHPQVVFEDVFVV